MIQNIEFALLLLAPLATQNYCLHQDCSTLGYSPQTLRYTCADFTSAAVIKLRQNGFDAFPMCGGFHAWVGVNVAGRVISVEPQTGLVVDYHGHRCVVRGVA